MRPSELLLAILAISPALAGSAGDSSVAPLDDSMRSVESLVIAWRRDIHQNPELSNREFRTSRLVAEHLKELGLEVKTSIAHTGVIGFLKGGLPGPTIALRADMDALPVTEKTDVPFRSTVKTTYRGETVGVMHACGHDAHVAILMGVAQTLSRLRDSLAGNVLFVFQPAEEGPPEGEEGGAALMLKQGLFDHYEPQAVFGLHMTAQLTVGHLGYRSGPIMAASDSFRVVVNGRQTHEARPWQGIDPIVTAAQIVEGLQIIVSRRTDITATPAVVSVGAIKGGIRPNIIPASVEMMGTIRMFTPEHRRQIIDDIERIARGVAAANEASVEVTMNPSGVPVLVNDPVLTERMLPTLGRVAGAGRVHEMALITAYEDFAHYAQKVPGLFFFVGVTPEGQDVETAPAYHSDYFYIDEEALAVGLRALSETAMSYLTSTSRRKA
jgi:amidohydrolase